MVPEFFDALFDVEDMDFDEDEGWFDDDSDVDVEDRGGVLADALSDDYADAEAEAFDDALAEVLDSMSAAEAFSFAKALKQIERTAGKVVSDPVFKQVAGTALPIAGGALGTLVGGGAGFGGGGAGVGGGGAGGWW